MSEIVTEVRRSRLSVWRERLGWMLVASLVVAFWSLAIFKLGIAISHMFRRF